MPLRTVLVEDEPVSRDRLRRLLQQHREQLMVVAEADNGPAAVEVITKHEPDLVLLDVSLPGLDGFEVLGSLRTSPPAVIITTAYDEYAVRAFRANAIDYLLKPIDPEQLAVALGKVRLQHTPPYPQSWVELLPILRATRHRELKRIACRVGDSTIFVQIDEVQYFRSDQGYTLVKCNARELLIDTPLSELESRLDSADFVRVHRSTLVNMNHVTALRRLFDGRIKILLNDGSELESSRRYADNLRNWP